MTKDILIWSLAVFAGVAFLVGVAVGHWMERHTEPEPSKPRRKARRWYAFW